MRINRQSVRLTLMAVTLLMFAGSCALFSDRRGPYGPEDPETNVTKTALPAAPPVPHKLEIVQSVEQGHVRPKAQAGVPAAALRPSAPVAPTLSSAEEAELQQVALKDPRVRELLGARYAFIEAHVIKANRKPSTGCCPPSSRMTRLTYYSYTNNVAVEVRIKEATVVSAERREGYIPPEGEQEVKEAVELARKDTRLMDKLQGLEGRALLMEPESGYIFNDPGYGHRVLWVTFERDKSGDPLFWAIVDLSDQKVLEAGAEPKRVQPNR